MSKRAKKPKAAPPKRPAKPVRHKKADEKVKEKAAQRVKEKAEEPVEEKVQEKVEQRVEEAKPSVPEQQKPQRPKGATPVPSVTSRRDGDTVERRAKGYSLGELKGAALPLRLAFRWRLPVDVRRRSVLEGNVSSLTAWLGRTGPAHAGHGGGDEAPHAGRQHKKTESG